MRCAYCEREFEPRRRWLRSNAWCSGACRRRMTREARDLMLWVNRWGTAVERPATRARYDAILPRFVAASLHGAPVAARPVRREPYVDLGELPVDNDA